jgi:hypothetical protein
VAKQNTKIPVSKLQVLELISDKIALGLFNHIGKNRESSEDLKQVLGLTRKQYYSRCSRLVKLGLIKRKEKSLVLTSLRGRCISIADKDCKGCGALMETKSDGCLDRISGERTKKCHE